MPWGAIAAVFLFAGVALGAFAAHGLQGTLDERALEMIDSQEHSLTAMTNLLNSLLDISRLDAGAVTPEFEDFPMQRLIDRLSPEFARQAQHKGLEFTSCGCTSTVCSDPNLLSEIIQNLVGNAIRYTDPGGVVNVRTSRDNGDALVVVSDTGVGIPARDIPRVFERFYRVDSARSRETGGTGLGLAIVRHVADRHGGSVDVESELGAGTTFTMRLPIS